MVKTRVHLSVHECQLHYGYTITRNDDIILIADFVLMSQYWVGTCVPNVTLRLLEMQLSL